MRFAIILTLAAGVLFAQQRRELPWEKNRMQVGQALYRENCIVCHDIDRPQAESKKLGPSFYQLFKQPRMPLANQPPNRAYVAARVRFGGALMPAYQKTMTAAEIETLLDYMETK